MKVIIAGCRDFTDYDFVLSAIEDSGFLISEAVSGGAPGVDTCGELLAEEAGCPVKRFSADWQANGKSAGPIRNRQMADYAEALIAIWDGQSPGTRNMISEMKKLGKPVFVAYFKR